MQILVVTLGTICLVSGSLEPADYQPPSQRFVQPPSTNYLPPLEDYPPARQYLDPSSQYVLGGATPSPIPIPTTEYLDETAVSSLPLRSYVPPSSEPIRNPTARQQFARRPGTYLTPTKQKPFRLSTTAPSATTRTPANKYLAPDKFSGYQYGARDNAISNTPKKAAKYEFQYRVNDNYGNDYSHHESRDGDSTWGMFSVLLPDGRRQIVHYNADANGYRPRITYENPPFSKSNQFSKTGPY